MRILRHEVPVDDEWHKIGVSGEIYPFVNASFPHIVEFWTLESNGPVVIRNFRVVGTGQPLPFSNERTYNHIGTAIFKNEVGRLVWHLFEEID